MRYTRFLALLCCLLTLSLAAVSADYTTYLTPARGFTEIKNFTRLVGNPQYCYILTSAEDAGLIVGVGKYEVKPEWASEETKALRYNVADKDPVLDLSNFFTIEKTTLSETTYIGFRNIVYSADMFQTHDNAGYLYVNTFTDKEFDEWSYLMPSFQDGYWLFESGKYPVSSDNWACGYLGPWNRSVAAGEPIALNRRNTEDDKAGRFRLFRIEKTRLTALRTALLQEQLKTASVAHPVDVTTFVTNPSFETGDETGWTRKYIASGETEWTILSGSDENEEFKTREYGMTHKDGGYLMNAYQWWTPSLCVSQTLTDIPCGKYALSAVVATWADREMTFAGNETTVTLRGEGDATGIPVTLDVYVDKGELTIEASANADWWSEGHPESASQTFFKIDDVKLTCKGLYINEDAQKLPNNDRTLLKPHLWYYYDVDYPCVYWLVGNLDGMVYSYDGTKIVDEAVIAEAEELTTLHRGRVYFKTTRSDATLSLSPAQDIQELGTFTCAALNVDGLPNKIATYTLNPDGPGHEGTRKISQYLASKGYDFIGCSEDFNYNGALMESLSAQYSCGTIRNTLSVGDIDYWQLIQGKLHVDTDGLNLIWKNSTVSASGESWTQWYDTEATDGNQYINKGYRHYDMTIDGNDFDVFILHMDAGDTNATWSRESQWRQIADAVNATDARRPKLIIGDTNSRWTREDITANFVNRLNTNLIASDVWVELYRDGVYPTTTMDDLTDQSNPTNYGNYEIVDKIIYINPTAEGTLQFKPTRFCIEQDYTYGNIDGTDDSTPLGDHKPVVVTFKYLKAGDYLEDGIREVEVKPYKGEPKDGAVFDLSGRRVTNSSLRKGFYIINGKKVLIH